MATGCFDGPRAAISASALVRLDSETQQRTPKASYAW